MFLKPFIPPLSEGFSLPPKPPQNAYTILYISLMLSPPPLNYSMYTSLQNFPKIQTLVFFTVHSTKITEFYVECGFYIYYNKFVCNIYSFLRVFIIFCNESTFLNINTKNFNFMIRSDLFIIFQRCEVMRSLCVSKQTSLS